MADVVLRSLDHVGVMVDDINPAVEWYRDVLGFAVRDQWANDDAGMKWAHVALGDFTIEFVERPGLERRSPATVGYHHIAFTTDDCVATTDSLVASGGSVIFAPSFFDRHDMDWSFVADPFGNVLEIISYRNPPVSN